MQIISRRGVSLDVGKLWGEIRGKYDNLEDDENLVQFFTEVLQMKQPRTDQARSNVGGPSEQLIN